MLVADLDTQNPAPHTLLNIQMVVWQDGQGKWAAAEDRCPHRFAAPLAKYAAAYHSFDLHGTCCLKHNRLADSCLA